MAFSQVDPSRLQGDDLRRWHLRIPAEIEQERQGAQAQRYNAFFGGIRPTTHSPVDRESVGGASTPREVANNDDFPWGFTGPNSWSTGQSPGSDFNSKSAKTPAGGQQFAENGQFCPFCHGPSVAPPPPALAIPPNWPLWTPGPNLTPRKPSKPHPKQCAQQNMNDSRICSREPGDALKSVCLESAAEREAHCIASDGEVGWPPLQTHDRR